MGWALGSAVVCALLAGCARPEGVLFAPVDPPIVWPRAPEQARIRWTGSIGGSQDLHAGVPGSEVALAALRGPRPAIRLSGPLAVALNEGELLAVADGRGAAVHIIDLGERRHATISGWAGRRFDTPIGAAWAGERLFVTDAGLGVVVELDAQGSVRGVVGEAELTRPVGICYVSDREQLYVVDGGAHDIAVFDMSGELVSRIGQAGGEPGRFNFPTYVCWDGGNQLLVADTGNFRVQLMDLDGNHARVFGRKGDGAGDLALPKGVAFDSEGHVYVVDAQFENVQVFDGEGRLLLAFGGEGSGRGEFWLPAGLAIDGNDRIWVADTANRRIQVFDYLGSAG